MVAASGGSEHQTTFPASRPDYGLHPARLQVPRLSWSEARAESSRRAESRRAISDIRGAVRRGWGEQSTAAGGGSILAGNQTPASNRGNAILPTRSGPRKVHAPSASPVRD